MKQDTPPPINTFRRYLWETVSGLAYWRAYWGRRILGGAMGIVADLFAEAATQSFYARLPSHPQQAEDSLVQVGHDRGFFRYRGESLVTFAARVLDAWSYYEQGGTPQVMKRVINDWGSAGWPATWNSAYVTVVESGDRYNWTTTLTIGFGAISPPWIPWNVGDPGIIVGEPGLYVGVGISTDIDTLLGLVRKWKRSASKYQVVVYYSVAGSITFTV